MGKNNVSDKKKFWELIKDGGILLVSVMFFLKEDMKEFGFYVIWFVLIVVVIFSLFDWFNIGGDSPQPISFRNHRIFLSIEEWRLRIISRFVVGDNPVKSDLFRELLIIVLALYKDKIVVFLSCLKFDDVVSIKTDILHLCNDITTGLVLKIEREEIKYINSVNAYSEEDKNTMIFVASKFLYWHTRKLELFRIESSKIIDDLSVKNIDFKVEMVLSLLEMLLLDLVRDSTITFGELNGDLAALKFKGKIIGC